MSIFHNHHIIPKHAGGTDHPDNIARLTPEEHAEAHRLLFEKYGRWQDRIAYEGLLGFKGKEQIIKEIQSRPKYTATEETRKKMSESGKKRHRTNPFSEEARAKMSAANKGEKNSMYGKKHTPETRAKISEANMGNPPTIGMTGKKHSLETIEKLREMNKGEKNPMYGITGEKHHMYGKKHSSETIEKIREGNRGKEVSEETRKKLREINKGRRRDRYGRLLPKQKVA